MAGLFPPSDGEKFDKSIGWQPIPVHTVPRDIDVVSGERGRGQEEEERDGRSDCSNCTKRFIVRQQRKIEMQYSMNRPERNKLRRNMKNYSSEEREGRIGGKE